MKMKMRGQTILIFILIIFILNATRGGAPPCRHLNDFGRYAMISESKTASPTQPAGVLDYIKDSLHLVLSLFL